MTKKDYRWTEALVLYSVKYAKRGRSEGLEKSEGESLPANRKHHLTETGSCATAEFSVLKFYQHKDM